METVLRQALIRFKLAGIETDMKQLDASTWIALASYERMALPYLQDKKSGDWWVYYGFNSVPTGVGYFPKSLFSYLANKANQLAFGGAVVAHRAASTPPMGSGSFPNGGQGRAASFTNLGIIDKEGNTKPIMADFPTLVTNNKCHSITPINHAACLYGGPGGCVR
ncbi:hypothetical protein TRIUR3_03365 [Triticum urartu]|uniref:Neprosin PEP catalytic domain-containing protein n=1 Tax=Triticum urartu TaxID=4572 RepID=M8ARG7_TRIUA|nr:hypothetical protein TRIUR3_03365 [Triticum urartu]